MEDTSERIILNEQRKDEADYYVYLIHLASYKFANKYALGKKVLDYGCGTGYGSQILSTVAENVVGIDISSEAIAFAQNNYKNSNINYLKVDNGILPFKNNSFDLVTSFQVIEHLFDAEKYLNEIYRVLKPEGYLILTTPDRDTRLFSFQKPWNYYHNKEYSIKSLVASLSVVFNEIRILKIGADRKLVSQELKRRKFTRLITLPFTLGIYPDLLRKTFLRILKKIYYSKPQTLGKDNKILKYMVTDIKIDNIIYPHTDLMSICKKAIV